MIEKIQTVLDIWHKHFEDEKHQYSEFEKSDIEYFVACLLYNHFAFSKALDTMKTMDLSYDFISECGDEYDEILAIIKTINYKDELEALELLQNFVLESKKKYSFDESYLLRRMQNHLNALLEIYETQKEIEKIQFIKPKQEVKSKNPLDYL